MEEETILSAMEPILSNVKVRRASEEDITDILEIMQKAFNVYIKEAELEDIEALHETEEDILKDICNKTVLVAEMDDKVVGTLRLKIRKDGTAYLERFGVDDSRRKVGVGRVLMRVVDDIMYKHRVKKLYLHTSTRMSATVRFYYGQGFHIVGVDNDLGHLRGYFVKIYEYDQSKE